MMDKDTYLATAAAFMKNVYASDDIGGDLFGVNYKRNPEFFKIVEDLIFVENVDTFTEKPLSKSKASARPKKPATPDHVPSAFVCRVKVGGKEGGNCYGSEPVEFSVVPKYNNLDHMLALFIHQHFDNFPFLSFQAIKAKVKMTEDCVGEYYGNRTDYALYSLRFDDMWPEVERYLEKEAKLELERSEMRDRMARLENQVRTLLVDKEIEFELRGF